jgi:hypothetical protein
MSLTTTIAEKGIPLLRDFTRWFSWDRISQRCRSWSVLEWLEPWDAAIKFGEQSIVSKVVETNTALRALGYLYPSTEEQHKEYDPLAADINRQTSFLIGNITTLLLNGPLVAKGYRHPMIHDAPYLPVKCSEWRILRLDIDEGSAEGEGIKYVGMTIGKADTKHFFQRCHTSIS